MKNYIKTITLIALLSITFSCSKNEDENLISKDENTIIDGKVSDRHTKLPNKWSARKDLEIEMIVPKGIKEIETRFVYRKTDGTNYIQRQFYSSDGAVKSFRKKVPQINTGKYSGNQECYLWKILIYGKHKYTRQDYEATYRLYYKNKVISESKLSGKEFRQTFYY